MNSSIVELTDAELDLVNGAGFWADLALVGGLVAIGGAYTGNVPAALIGGVVAVGAGWMAANYP